MLQDIKSIKEEKELEEINRRQYELDDLRCRCNELDKALKNSQDRAENLQNAVGIQSCLKWHFSKF